MVMVVCKQEACVPAASHRQAGRTRCRSSGLPVVASAAAVATCSVYSTQSGRQARWNCPRQRRGPAPPPLLSFHALRSPRRDVNATSILEALRRVAKGNTVGVTEGGGREGGGGVETLTD